MNTQPLPPARVLHAVLTVATGGLWALVWIDRERRYRKAQRAHQALLATIAQAGGHRG